MPEKSTARNKLAEISLHVDFAWYCHLVTDAELPPSGTPGLPERHLTPNQVVAHNMAAFRKAAGMNQEEMGQRLGGWSTASVSAAERSQDGKRIRKFDADEITAIAAVLGVPVAALLLPPEDDGIAFRYILDLPGEQTMLLADIVPMAMAQSSAYGTESPAVKEFRRRFLATDWHRRAHDASRQTSQEGREKALNLVDGIIRTIAERAASVAQGASVEPGEIERETMRRLDETLGKLHQQQVELERRVDDLRAFEREYRSRLRQALEAQYRAFWAGVEGIDADGLLEAIRKVAETRGPSGVTAVLLSGDGVYDILTAEQAAELARERDEREEGGLR